MENTLKIGVELEVGMKISIFDPPFSKIIPFIPLIFFLIKINFGIKPHFWYLNMG
jgi:hypothetical protein